jgi:hypothetical protein
MQATARSRARQSDDQPGHRVCDRQTSSIFGTAIMSTIGLLWIWLLGAPLVLGLFELMITPKPRR